MKNLTFVKFLTVLSLLLPNLNTQAFELDFSPIISCTVKAVDDAQTPNRHWKIKEVAFGGGVIEPIEPLSIFIKSTQGEHFQVLATEKAERQYLLEAKNWSDDINGATSSFAMIEAGKWMAFNTTRDNADTRTVFYILRKDEDPHANHVESICKSILDQMDSSPTLMNGDANIPN